MHRRRIYPAYLELSMAIHSPLVQRRYALKESTRLKRTRSVLMRVEIAWFAASKHASDLQHILQVGKLVAWQKELTSINEYLVPAVL